MRHFIRKSMSGNRIFLPVPLLMYVCILILPAFRLAAQDISAYVDYRGYLYAFDKGTFHKLEYLPPTSYKVGGNAVAYIDNKNDFRIYYGGEVYTQLNAADFYYTVTENLVAYRVGRVLYVFDEGEKKTLSYYSTMLTTCDSVLAFFDDSNYNLYTYYNHRMAELESSLLEVPRSLRCGPNTIAWINQSNFFNVFYQGRTFTLDNIAPLSFSPGRDIVAYVDGYDHYFHLFYYGDTAMVETFAPDSFKVGYGIMAYTDYLGNFRVFSKGKTDKLLSDRPDFFKVQGNIITYAYNRSFYAWYQGRVYNLETFVPSDIQTGINGVAWLDESGRLMFFDRGKTYTASYEVINSYSLDGNVLKFEVGTNTTHMFFEGQTY